MRQAWRALRRVPGRVADAITWAIEVPVLGIVIAWLLFPFMIAGWLLVIAPFVAALVVFWTAPTVVWLSVFHNVSVIDAATYAVTAANGRPEYETAWGTRDPSVVAFGIFNLLAWGAFLLALVILAAPFFIYWDWREHRRRQAWLVELRRQAKEEGGPWRG
jgi:hypothetical protein